MTTSIERTTVDLGPRPDPRQRRRGRRGRRVRRVRLVTLLALAVALTAGCALAAVRQTRDADLHRNYLGSDGWPTDGQAAYRLGSITHVGPHQRPAPIASVAKVMTAYLVLRAHPLSGAQDGPRITITGADVADYRRRKADDQSVVAVRAGERLTERQALQAMLLPSANNVAVVLARFVSGRRAAFVDRMNATARALGMTDTTYTDPSGFDDGTVSTARDQLRLATALARDDATGQAFSELVADTSVVLPVAGRVTTTDALLGHDGFTGTKTGSDDAAGGCFVFHTWRLVHGRVTEMIGVVLGQHGRHAVTAGLYAAKQLADRTGPAANGI